MRLFTTEELENQNFQYKCFYNMPIFHSINEHKVNNVVTFLYGEKKVRAAFTFGKIGNDLTTSYSSPFSMVEFFKNCTIEDVDIFIREIDEYASENKIHSISITLPPMFYDETNITKVLSSLLRNGYYITENELNYQIFISSEEEYLGRLQKNAKKNLNHALKVNFYLKLCENEEEKKVAYDIIKANREGKGYNLSMNWDEVRETIIHVEHDFFLLYRGEIPIASAIVFRVTREICQVVYWGDIMGYSEDRPINYLAYKLYMYYLEKGIRVLDIGPSMIDGQPNYGLCDFKESIGCDISSKFILRKDY